VQGMKPGIRATGPRWLLLSLLLLGVVSMHHFVPADAHGPATVAATTMADMPGPDPMHQPEDPASPSPLHDLQHLCMAVLGAILGLLLIGFLLAFCRRRPLPSIRRVRHIRRTDRPPRLSGRTLLSSVCVLRV
jgi:hypothetical protein